MTPVFRATLAVLVALFTAGCATQPTIVPSAVVTPQQSKVVTLDRTKDAVAVGKSTKADVRAALGETQVISFDNGFEVWVYRLADGASGSATTPQRTTRRSSGDAEAGRNAEFVILFNPSGLVVKTRMRPAPFTRGG